MQELDHIRITAEAVRCFVKISRSPVAPLLLRHTSLVQDGAKDADIPQLYSRTTNWHYYSGNLHQDVITKRVFSFHEPLVFYLTSEHILGTRVKQLSQEVAKGSIQDCCTLLGRILHHIQDMSSPSHVVPVFHGVHIPDSFENYLSTVFLGDYNELAAIASEVPEMADEGGATAPLEIYKQAAEETFRVLNETRCPARVNTTTQTLPWSYFWQPEGMNQPGSEASDCQIGGFGSYGHLGNAFGTTSEIRVEGTSYQIEREAYDDLCHYLVREMLGNSIATLQALEPGLSQLC